MYRVGESQRFFPACRYDRYRNGLAREAELERCWRANEAVCGASVDEGADLPRSLSRREEHRQAQLELGSSLENRTIWSLTRWGVSGNGPTAPGPRAQAEAPPVAATGMKASGGRHSSAAGCGDAVWGI